LLLLLLLL
jgi:hypothetical protein